MRKPDRFIDLSDAPARLAVELDDAVLDVASRLGRAKDAAIAEMSRALVAKAQIIRMSMMSAPLATKAVSDVDHLYFQLMLLEGRVMRSRVKQSDRAAVTFARALGFRLAQRLAIVSISTV